MGSLDGRVAIVTGAGRGIGRSIALLLAKEGASVVVNDLGVAVDGTQPDSGPADDTVAEITKAGGKAVANHDSVADYDASENIIRSALDNFGKLDVLVNVAGILRDRMIFNMNEEEWDAVVDVHMKGTFNTTKYASIYWRQAREGNYRLINFTSVSGLNGAPGQPNYAAAKLGIVGLTYSCANALARYGVTANAISPGAATRMGATIPEERRRGGGMGMRDEREGSPDNVAIPVAYLASADSGWINGQVIGANGYNISLYNTYEPIRTLQGNEPWTLEGASRRMREVFRPAIDRTSFFSQRQEQPPQQ
jgi:NAD(P)-dependent dehydrogenase (short-subunit alcohol dehydrogenase family)